MTIRVGDLIKMPQPDGSRFMPLPEMKDPHFHPSPGKAVQFADGKIMNLNRRTRRRLKLYGPRVSEVRR